MKKPAGIRMLCIIMVLALLVPFSASAEEIDTGTNRVPVYDAKNGNRLSYSASVRGNFTNDGGWYRIPGQDGTDVWISRADVVAAGGIVDGTVVIPSAEPTSSDGAITVTPVPSGVVVVSPSPSASAAVTITPPPASIGGAPDTTYEGTILHFTVGQGGLWLYDKVDGREAVVVKQGEKLTLTTPVLVMEQVTEQVANPNYDANNPGSEPEFIDQQVTKEVPRAGWASLYYSGKTYYVPTSSLQVQEEEGKPNMNVASVTIGENGADYYTELNADGTVKEGTKSGNLAAGRRINARYATTAGRAFAFDVSTNEGGVVSKKTYYFSAQDIQSNSGSTASIGSNDNDKLLTQITVKTSLRLYRSTDFVDYLLLQADSGKPISIYGTLETDANGVKQHYKVTYGGTVYYVKIADKDTAGEGDLNTDSEDFDLNHVGYNDVVLEDTFWITLGTEGGYYYTTPSRDASNKAKNSAGQLPAGKSMLASHYSGDWYAIVQGDYSRVYYLHRDSLAGSVSTNEMSSIKSKVQENTVLYSSMEDMIDSGERLNKDGLQADQYFTLRPINNSWYSVLYNSKQYYVRASQVKDDTSDPISSTTEGKTYSITIGMEGGTLYKDVGCTQAYMPLMPGQKVQATRYSSQLYTVALEGSKFYLPVRDISLVLGGDDAANIEDENKNQEDIGNVIGGEKDDSFDKTILNYTVPQGGIWLYSAYEPSAIAAMVINAGTKLQLTAVSSNDATTWYTTWYGGKQYYVNKASMSAGSSTLSTTQTYSVTLNGVSLSDIQFYKKYNTTTGLLSEPVSLPAGFAGTDSQINVRIAGFEPKSKTTDPNVVAAYSINYAGITYYFAPYDSAKQQTIINQDDLLLATVGSNLDASLITKLVMEQDFRLNTTPDTPNNLDKNKIDVTIPSSGSLTLYGVKYDENWYKVVYNSKVRYLAKSEYMAKGEGKANPDQLSISDGATSSTFTVVIGNGGADVYSRPSTNTTVMKDTNGTILYEIGAQNRIDGMRLSSGAAVLASHYDTNWYTTVISGTPVYFRKTNIVNENANAAIGSRIITLTTRVPYYTTTTDNASIQSTASLEPGRYTFRTIDSTWSSVFYNGRNVYVRNNSINADDELNSTPVASTSVGKTYTIVVGSSTGSGSVDVYTSSDMNTKLASIEGGTKTTGTLMYIERASGDTKPSLVYKISYGGTTGYIAATEVVGVQSGDEATEGKVTEEEEKTEGVGVGQTIYINLNAGTILYEKKDTSSTYTVISSTGAYELKKEDANWYSMVYNTVTYYIPRVEVEAPAEDDDDGSGGSSGGAEIPINTTFFETTKSVINLYAEPNTNSSIVGTLLPGQMIQLTKISETWYEYNPGTGARYIRGSELFGAPSVGDGGTSSGGVTTDTEGGIITPTIRISATSGTVNLRKKASTAADSTIMERIPKDTVLTNEGYTKDSNGQLWYKVTYKGKTGYVIGSYVSAVGTVGGSTSDPTVVGPDPSQDIGRTLTVNVSSVNIRNNAGTGAGIVGKLEKGAIIVPTGYKTGTDGMIWYSFQFSTSVTGWIRYDYLSGGIASTTELSGNVAIKAGDTNLRSGAGNGFGVITKLARDTVVTIIGSGTDTNNLLWYRVTVDGTNVSGYVRSDLVRQLTLDEQNKLQATVVANYKELRHGSTGTEVLALQQQLILIGYLQAGQADGTYGAKTTAAVTAFQKAKGLSATGVATPATQAAIFNTTVVATGTTTTLDWFTSGGQTLLERYPNIQIYDIKSGVTWNATFINGANHADVVPATKADAQKLVAASITGSYIRRPVLVTINQQKYAGSMYAVGHGKTNYVDYFTGVMCIHFTGSKTHESNKVDADHQQAIQDALIYANTYGQ